MSFDSLSANGLNTSSPSVARSSRAPLMSLAIKRSATSDGSRVSASSIVIVGTARPTSRPLYFDLILLEPPTTTSAVVAPPTAISNR